MSRSPYLKLNKKNSSLLVYITSVLSLCIFLYGFFPFNLSSNAILRKDTGNKYSKTRYIDKLAFIVIDALRHDFVMPNGGHNYMPFVSPSILNNESCFIITKAHSPTVTLPRLKAITSGSLSTYIDVVLNFMTPSFEEENLINLAVSHGLKLVFYGDDTWLKLFPKSFLRSEGTTSFFTNDYVEVDYNVTRHIGDELKKEDWDIIILHFLGLDHIGHTEGPNSPLVQPKLLEMDTVVKRFFDHFEYLERTRGLKTMLIVTGDHGMKDSGSHGGVTYAEVTVPVVSIGNPCVNLPGWSVNNVPLQIDLAPTLSTLMGLPIPASNMGKIIPQLLCNMQKEDILKNLELNRMELSRTMTSSDKDSIKMELETWLLNTHKNQELGANITKRYYQILNQMSQKLVSTNTSSSLCFLLFGVILLWVCLILLVHDFFTLWPSPQTPVHWFFIFGTILHGISLFSTSFIEEEHQTWYFFWTTFCVFALLESLDCIKKNKKSVSDISSFALWIFLACIHRILRKLNQTGDKWAFLPDIKFYLNSEEGQLWLLLLFLLGAGMVFFCAFKEGCPATQLVTYGITLLAVIAYRVAIGNIKLKYIKFYSSRGLSEIFAFWISTSLFTIQTAYNKTPFYLVWLALSSLVLRPHNIILPPMQAYISKRLYRFFDKSGSVWNSIAHVWLGNVFYFYQGNGNSLSNVDVAAGFVGISTYKPVYAGVMIFGHTFNSHILSYILSPKSDLVFPLLRITPVTMYCTIAVFQLNHLFIWSVFSPKLLYESSITMLFLLLLILNRVLFFLKISM